MKATVGICEDDADLRSLLTRALADEDLAVSAVSTGSEAITVFSADEPDALILDVGLPDADGRDVCQALRAQGVTCPVLFLTARDAVVDRVAGFRAGGDDYLTKPFAVIELVVRVEALLRRSQPRPVGEADGVRPGGLFLDPAAHTANTAHGSVPLTPTEFRLLGALAAEPGAVVRRRALVQAGWPEGATVHDNTLDSYLARLRRKLRTLESAESIVTLRGVGYSLR